jgi:alpha-1,2-mannosyltransferase
MKTKANGMAAEILGAGIADWLARIGVVLWTIFNLVVVILVLRDPEAHSVVHVYRNGAIGWWRGDNIFGTGENGFIYLPVFAILYTPFALLGASLGDALWRLISVALLTYALWRSVRLHLARVSAADRFRAFGALLLLVLPAGSAALRNGQATTPMLALLLLSSVALAGARWWPAAALLALSLAVKPLAIVFLLLAAAFYPPLIARLLLCLLPMFLLPFVNPDPLAVWQLEQLGVAKLLLASHPSPGAGAWSDITALLRRFGLVLSNPAMMILRLLAALAVLGTAFKLCKHQDRAGASLALLALSICYLMLMNPRSEEQTYIMLSAAAGLYAVILWHVEDRRGLSLALAALCIALGNQGYGNLVVHATELWWKPLLCVLFSAFLLYRLGTGIRVSHRQADPLASPSGAEADRRGSTAKR